MDVDYVATCCASILGGDSSAEISDLTADFVGVLQLRCRFCCALGEVSKERKIQLLRATRIDGFVAKYRRILGRALSVAAG